MSQLDVDKDVYSASCNPPRRAKRPRISDADPNYTPRPSAAASPVGATVQPRPILPRRAPPPAKPLAPSTPSSGSPPSDKRGRKPGPLSRSAREAQRRLNHSIIEKARRTKINNALATLKELVPLDYGKKIKSQEDNSDDEGEPGEEDDDDGEYGTGAGDGSAEKKKPKPKPSGKKEEKEREYKLEILVRTVAFMQDLLQRIAVLEQQQTNSNPVCSKCGGGLDNPAPTHTTRATGA
ncbi:hypothetical protein AN958_05309 [Leucoagaricus sp. SymC.cos]|nr:hypothetical protein AN958_06827 [Leucoagaricus sp. SymC.cos]KXN89769.1 hypothetical protein AN958_05309 [Leucoagaricus sp. SymC.cos]